VDYGNNEAANTPTDDFTTEKRFRSASFTYKYKSGEANDTSREASITATADVLKISKDLITVRTDYSPARTFTTTFTTKNPTNGTTSSGGLGVNRGLQDSSYTVDYIILPDPNSDSEISPLSLANSLLDYRTELAAKIDQFDESYYIIGEEVFAQEPEFVKTPIYQQINEDNELIIADVALKNDGTVYTCLLENTEDDLTLTSYQVVNGLDQNNYPCSKTPNVVNPTSSSTIVIPGIEIGKDYVAFTSATNSI
jgi:hypothetical protein